MTNFVAQFFPLVLGSCAIALPLLIAVLGCVFYEDGGKFKKGERK